MTNPADQPVIKATGSENKLASREAFIERRKIVHISVAKALIPEKYVIGDRKVTVLPVKRTQAKVDKELMHRRCAGLVKSATEYLVKQS
ncbi:MAG: hypothetical protein E4H19_11595 [Chromatiales bacterium]|jgi:hypothetical protein|nr:MAG: hypothetical protein E4H19_11595 [Chromatiales bacterium]